MIYLNNTLNQSRQHHVQNIIYYIKIQSQRIIAIYMNNFVLFCYKPRRNVTTTEKVLLFVCMCVCVCGGGAHLSPRNQLLKMRRRDLNCVHTKVINCKKIYSRTFIFVSHCNLKLLYFPKEKKIIKESSKICLNTSFHFRFT